MNSLTAFILLTGASSLSFASPVTISFTILPAILESSTYTATGATYNGETTVTIDGFANQALICDDFVDTTYVPSNGIAFTVESLSNLSGAMFKSGYEAIKEGGVTYTLTESQAYDTAAVLVSELEGLVADSHNANAITDDQYALWDLMNPGAADSTTRDDSDRTTTAVLQTAFALVQSNSSVTQAEEKALVIYTPTSAYLGYQEELGMNTTTNTASVGAPEPAAWVLEMALGLILCLPRVRSRLRTSKASRP